METIASLAGTCRVATAHDAVYKDECCYTFLNDELWVRLSDWTATTPALASKDRDTIFLRITREEKERKPLSSEMNSNEPITKLAIGVPGGFDGGETHVTVTTYAVVVVQADGTIAADVPYVADDDDSNAKFPEAVRKSIESVIQHAGVSLQSDVQAWQTEDIPVSKYAAELPFVENGVTIDPNPSTWKCQKSGDTENLWLNLSDGFIGGGRKNWDGSGGSNGALDHFEETGKLYPLVVKLGTLTADLDTADCYSYAPDEDGPVKVPNLAELLSKRGIQLVNMQKTVKSTAELEVELNATYAFDAITESGCELEAVSGPGLKGLQNLGNSCYMNSVFQLLFTIPELISRYGGDRVLTHPLIINVPPTAAPHDLLCQTAKVACAITSGTYQDEKYHIAPRMMKHCIGKDHVDFRTMQQQDAPQFLQYFLERLDRAELKASSSSLQTSHLFSYGTVSRLRCSADSKIKYKESDAPETVWSLPIPMEKAEVTMAEPDQKRMKGEDGKEDATSKPVPRITLQTCIEQWASDTTVDDLRWPHLGNASHSASQTVRLANFPRYLLVQMQRYELGPDWQPIKLEVNLDVPHELDLTAYKSTGPSEGETLIPEDAEVAPPEQQPAIDEAAVAQLMDMGFSMNSCKRALLAVGGNNVEAAMGWVFEHNMDPDFNDPVPDTPAAASKSDSTVDEGVVESLVASLGAFTSDQVRAALQQTSGAADRAADWLFSHMDDLEGAIAALNSNKDSSSATIKNVELEDGTGVYELMGMISHIGKNTGSGHYVAHLKKNGKWVIFNDEKVALSSKPPFEHAYLYLYQRKDTIGSPHPEYK